MDCKQKQTYLMKYIFLCMKVSGCNMIENIKSVVSRRFQRDPKLFRTYNNKKNMASAQRIAILSMTHLVCKVIDDR